MTRCETCRWSETGTRGPTPVLECHRMPPQNDGWPAVRPNERCGEYAASGWKGYTEEERRKAEQLVRTQDFFRRLARVGRTP